MGMKGSCSYYKNSVRSKKYIDKTKNCKEGNCIFPNKMKYNYYNKCTKDYYGLKKMKYKENPICATSLTPRGYLKTYAYCDVDAPIETYLAKKTGPNVLPKTQKKKL